MNMLAVSFSTSVLAILQIFAMGLVGFILVRRNIVTEEGLKLLSFLSVNILFPLFIFYQITHFFNPREIHLWWAFPLINTSLIIIGMIIMSFVFAVQRHKLKDEYLAASSLHNAGYIPLLLAMSLPLGAMAGKVYSAVIISIIGFDLCLWSVGVWLMTRAQSPKMDLKNLFNPPLIAMSSAIILVLLGIHGAIPESVYKPIKTLGEGAMGIAMIIIGGNLARTHFNKIQPQALVGTILIKLLVLPLLALTCLLFLHLDPMISFIIMVQACMPTSITLSIIGRHYQTQNQDFINQSIFFTHILCMFTLPIFLALYSKLMN